jgi:hypothetical protein
MAVKKRNNLQPRIHTDEHGFGRECRTAGEAIRHLSWDFADSRLGLIGLSKPKPVQPDSKGLFLTTDETRMNTDLFNAERRRRKGAETSLKEAGEVFVERARHLRADGPSQGLFASKRLDAHPLFDVGRESTVAPFSDNRTRSKFIDLHVVRQFPAINKHPGFPQKEVASAGLAKSDKIHTLGYQAAKRFGFLRVVGDAADRLFHERRVA